MDFTKYNKEDEEQFLMWKKERDRLLLLSVLTNRSKGQTERLYNLCDADFDKLLALEVFLKEKYYYTPSTDLDLQECFKDMLGVKLK